MKPVKYSNSKKLAWVIVGITTILTAYAIYNKLEGVAVAIFSTGIPAAVGLYINKQYQLRKEYELECQNK